MVVSAYPVLFRLSGVTAEKSTNPSWPDHPPPALILSPRHFHPGGALKWRGCDTKTGHLMRNRVKIRALARSGLTITEIARVVGCSRGAVYRALAPDARLTYQRSSRWDREGAAVGELLSSYPQMSSVALAARSGWSGSLRQLQREVHRRRSDAVRNAETQGVIVRPAPVLSAPSSWR